MPNDLVFATSQKLGIHPRRIFEQAVLERGFKDVKGQAGYRFEQWFKTGETTPVVENYCLNFWRSHEPQHSSANL